jgi:hypothetical protein
MSRHKPSQQNRTKQGNPNNQTKTTTPAAGSSRLRVVTSGIGKNLLIPAFAGLLGGWGLVNYDHKLDDRREHLTTMVSLLEQVRTTKQKLFAYDVWPGSSSAQAEGVTSPMGLRVPIPDREGMVDDMSVLDVELTMHFSPHVAQGFAALRDRVASREVGLSYSLVPDSVTGKRKAADVALLWQPGFAETRQLSADFSALMTLMANEIEDARGNSRKGTW